jgi:hypothetical protein
VNIREKGSGNKVEFKGDKRGWMVKDKLLLDSGIKKWNNVTLATLSEEKNGNKIGVISPIKVSQRSKILP